VMSSGRWYLV